MTKIDASLPRETNPSKARSILRRSLRLLATSRKVARTLPNVATIAKRRERALACWAQSRKVAFIRTAKAPVSSIGHAKARMSIVRKAARSYRNAILAWRAFYYGGGRMGD